ncbi:MAG: sulfatase-like hydrolase/transferase [Microthrixaceae bacterium]|nr:sulfatase-like hydrolase/transferase [Microthrixaceae bacterium]MCO5320433.1 sulfatase-like hydrolase/transferase [Microthrixaceae bacterium]
MNSSPAGHDNASDVAVGGTGERAPRADAGDSAPLWPWAPLEAVALGAFAITQPLYSLLGANATFFVANDITGSSVTWFAVAVLVIPAVIIAGIDLALIQLPGRWAVRAHGSLLGSLAALAIGVPLLRSLGAQGPAYLAGLAAAAILLSWLTLRWRRVREVARWALFAPFLFLGAFLLSSPIAAVRSGQSSGSASADLPTSDTSVVMLVFDQLPLTMLLDPDGTIDEQWYPGFARLAGLSTWYPNARAVVPRTDYSVPSLLTGTIPEPGELPVLSAHPDNLFTLLSETHDVYADEYVTQMCPADVCGDQPGPTSTIWKDTAIVAVRTLLDERTADALVPRVDGRWNDFGTIDGVPDEARSWEEVQEHRSSAAEDSVRFEQFLDSLDGVGDPDRPDLSYLHLFQPHEPLRYLPDGTNHNLGGPFAVDDEGVWPDDVDMMDARLQQYVAQVMNADRQVSELLDQLESTDRLEDTIVVVTSDHGVGAGPGMPNKAVPQDPDPAILTEQLAVPLFIATPGTPAGVDPAPVQLHDVAPTLLSSLGSTAELDLDGEPADEIPDDRAPVLLVGDELTDSVPFDPPTESMTVRRIRELMPLPGVPYAFGPAADRLGEPLTEGVSPDTDVSVALGGTEELSAVETDSGFLPAAVNATLTGDSAGTDWLITLNGVIAGGARPFEVDGTWHLSTLVDPSFFRDGPNDVGFLVQTPDGLRRVPDQQG